MVRAKGRENTRERIKSAAVEVFIEKGYDGTRMQEIATRAGANKAMIHYYFRSKSDLFQAILRETFEEMFQEMRQVRPLPKDIDPKELFPRLIHFHFGFLRRHPELPKLLAREIHTGNPLVQNILTEVMTKVRKDLLADILAAIRKMVQTQKLRPVDPLHTIWNVVSLSLFFFIAKPVLQIGWPEAFQQEEALFKKREKAIVDFILYGLLPR